MKNTALVVDVSSLSKGYHATEDYLWFYNCWRDILALSWEKEVLRNLVSEQTESKSIEIDSTVVRRKSKLEGKFE